MIFLSKWLLLRLSLAPNAECTVPGAFHLVTFTRKRVHYGSVDLRYTVY